MKLAYLLSLFLCAYCCFAQDVKTDLQKRNLLGKVKMMTLVLNDSKSDYQIDSFDTDGYLIKSAYITDQANGMIDSTYPYKVSFVNTDATLFTFDKQHHLLKSTYTAASDGEATSSSEYRYNNKWQLTAMLIENAYVQDTDTYEYNEKGKVVKEIAHRTVKTDSNYSRKQTLTYKYNDKNQLTEVNTTHSPKDATESVNVFYNMFDDFGYGSEGYFAGKAILKYNVAGKIIEQDIFDYKGRPNGRITCKYDEHNNIILLTQYITGKPAISSITYKYDDHGNWIEQRYSKDMIYTRSLVYY